jgi:DNA-binding NarL/FixJ family response regulator
MATQPPPSLTPNPVFLIVEDDDGVARSLARRLTKFGEPVVAGSLAAAQAELDVRRPTGMILDISLPDGSGLDWLERLAREKRDPCTLVLTGHDDRPFESRVLLIGHHLLHKPITVADIHHFARYCAAAEQLTAERARRIVARLASQSDLTLRQTQLLALAVARVDRRDWPTIVEVSPERMKKVIRSLLRRAGGRTLDDIASDIIRQVMTAHSSDIPPAPASDE